MHGRKLMSFDQKFRFSCLRTTSFESFPRITSPRTSSSDSLPRISCPRTSSSDSFLRIPCPRTTSSDLFPRVSCRRTTSSDSFPRITRRRTTSSESFPRSSCPKMSFLSSKIRLAQRRLKPWHLSRFAGAMGVPPAAFRQTMTAVSARVLSEFTATREVLGRIANFSPSACGFERAPYRARALSAADCAPLRNARCYCSGMRPRRL